ncbi:MAG: helicase-related protein [Candidatus Liptonbacteria bacterium]|nr:helicase-related protein [Candidatus Liptonbacteria bacterium]
MFFILKEKIEKILIAAVTLSFLEKEVSWFSQNFNEIERSRRSHDWYRRNTEIFEAGQKIKLSEFLRRIAELGYTKVWETGNRGEFSQRGGVVRIFPINSDGIIAVEFEGNFIAEIFVTPPTPLTLRGAEDGSAPLKVRGARGVMKYGDGATQFHSGDYVVHIDHGIGIFKRDTEEDFVIEYAAPRRQPNGSQAGKLKSEHGEPDLLFVPKKEIKRLSPYLGFKKPEIHRLGTPIWNITKRKAKEDIIAFAKELLASLAARKIVTRPPYHQNKEMEEELVANFPHEHTVDQSKAIAEVLGDMALGVPMERVLTGDVGFGKTEVAIAAALRAALNDRQVAVLAPTTILADQHFDVFRERLKGFGVEIARLTRLEDSSETKNILKKLESGALDIVIGTHKILGKSLKFKRLGLLIIDEEQKFGVAHKERFKKLIPELDILSLSATPIPRTLNIALSGIQPISSIETAPAGKSEIKTFVLPKNKKIMKEAIEAELARSGQIYFLANRIHKMPVLIEEINSLRTRARVAVLHGRMKDETIIKTMHDFRAHKYDLLLSTTIIENGMDLSNVNTLIVEDSTRFGLSQAHQLRGRIGRGKNEGFAYFLYPTHKLKEKAAERLEALERFSWLGAGLEIAKRDLEIRGAGNILGKAQSGIAYRVGLNLYYELLEEAVAELKN